MIEIQRGKSIYQYKINEYNQRQILKRPNRHNARWVHLETYNTPEEATAALLEIEKKEPAP